jgi:hypothetical protein
LNYHLKIHGRTSCKVVFAISFYEKTCGWNYHLKIHGRTSCKVVFVISFHERTCGWNYNLKIHGTTSCKVVFAISFHERTCGWNYDLKIHGTRSCKVVFAISFHERTCGWNSVIPPMKSLCTQWALQLEARDDIKTDPDQVLFRAEMSIAWQASTAMTTKSKMLFIGRGLKRDVAALLLARTVRTSPKAVSGWMGNTGLEPLKSQLWAALSQLFS